MPPSRCCSSVVNAAHARYLEVRRLLLIGRIDEAERTLAELDPAALPPASRTAHELVVAGIAIRRLRTKAARAALARAKRAAHHARIPARRVDPRTLAAPEDLPKEGPRSSDSWQAACRKLLDGQSLSADSRAHRAARVASKLIERTAWEGATSGAAIVPGDGAPRPNVSPLSAFVPGLSENSRGLWRRDTMSNAIINPLSAAKPPSH